MMCLLAIYIISVLFFFLDIANNVNTMCLFKSTSSNTYFALTMTIETSVASHNVVHFGCEGQPLKYVHINSNMFSSSIAFQDFCHY